ncbi:response regulator transcription factor [Thalassotalea sp. HSM 43]|uniref:response regulator transcription factor n=1 Tax=Thalassotalea sp. HSM 43 TaxID=2552945 RepID=UPI00167814B0|nr:response regulator transcription factor [Thalassotalea sp. HSM 43]
MTQLCKLLLIEDDLPLASLICQYLRANQCDVTHVSSGEEVDMLFNIQQFDIIICDVMLPDISGFDLFNNLRDRVECPVIFFTALDEDKDQIYGLELGAVDYVVKPVDPAILLARIKAQLRRSKPQLSTQLRLGELVLDDKQKTLYYDGDVVSLTIQEFDVLYLMAKHHQQVLPRDELFHQIIGREYDGLDRAIDLIISRMRKKLMALGVDSISIRAIRGKGYMLSYGG